MNPSSVPRVFEAKLMSGRAMLSTVKVGLTNFDLANLLQRKALTAFFSPYFSTELWKSLWIIARNFR